MPHRKLTASTRKATYQAASESQARLRRARASYRRKIGINPKVSTK